MKKITHGSLFSGIGGFDLASEWAGFENQFHCEINPFGRQVLNYHFPKSVSYDDITKTDFSEWRGKITVLTGGFPCQPFSLAGKRKGSDDDRYLWPEMLRAIGQIRPTWIVGENVIGITTMVQPGEIVRVESQAALFEENDTTEIVEHEFVIETICRDLEHLGYSVQPLIIPACSVNAPHRRDRVWFVARIASDSSIGELQGNFNSAESSQPGAADDVRSDLARYLVDGLVADSDRFGCPGRSDKDGPETSTREQSQGRDTRLCTGTRSIPNWSFFPTESPIYVGNDGISDRLDRRGLSPSKIRTEGVKACGNAIVPQVAYQIFKIISEIENNHEE